MDLFGLAANFSSCHDCDYAAPAPVFRTHERRADVRRNFDRHISQKFDQKFDMTAASTIESPVALAGEPAVDLGQAHAHGLSDDEYRAVERWLGRTPTFTELGVFSVMWSEHCSYKSSRRHLRMMPEQGAALVGGAGRERRRARRRRRMGRGVQNRKPQPSLVRRTLPGRRDRRGRNPARYFHDGRAADRQHGFAEVRRVRPSAHTLPARRRGRRNRRLRQLRRRADGRRAR